MLCGPRQLSANRTPEAYNLAVHHRQIGSNQDIKGVKKWLSKHFYGAPSMRCCPILQRLQKTFSRRHYSHLEWKRMMTSSSLLRKTCCQH
ncbi:hypothetical protein ATANTOWER_027425 [Ataeniobius toweri]|uniref:Uncharacterized protein n=1 Tax=Ataeniobius toweri TaxID=208326 RepID=A0ABU7A9F6_9TELE|nr:hypothetical protein [Ataeniobius toweri]